MKLDHIYVYGAGGHGKVVADSLRAAGLPIAGFVEDAAARWDRLVLDLPVVASEWLCAHRDLQPTRIALGIGDNRARQTVAERCRSWGLELVRVIHPAATISPSARIGPGTVILAGAVINADAQLGLGVIVNTGAVVEHDCILGDYAHLSSNATLGGAARVGALAHVGLGAVVLPGGAVGAQTVIGAGAVVVHSIPAGVVAFGVPARVRAPVGKEVSSCP